MDYKCHILHVKTGYEQRRESIVEQFSQLGISPQWILDYDIPDISSEILTRYRYHGALRPQEISCCLKHLTAWKRIADGADSGGMVFEDDVLIDLHRFQTVTKAALREFNEKKIPQHSGIICFGDGCALYVPWTKVKAGRCLYPAEYVRAADSYWLSREAAAQMHKAVMEHGFALPADHLIDALCTELAIPIFWTAPTVASQGSHTGRFRSGIQTQEKIHGLAKHIEWMLKKIRRKYIYPILGTDLTKK